MWIKVKVDLILYLILTTIESSLGLSFNKHFFLNQKRAALVFVFIL